MQRTKVAITLAGGLVIAGASVLLFSSLARHESPPVHRAPVPNELGCGGAPTTLTVAAAAMTFALELPNTELANPANVQQVLLCSSDQVEFDFGTGVILTLGVNHLADPAGEWARLANEYPEFSTGSVRGVPASLADPSKGALGGVDLVEDGVRITVTGNGSIPLTDLVTVTESIQPTVTPTPPASPTPSATLPTPAAGT